MKITHNRFSNSEQELTFIIWNTVGTPVVLDLQTDTSQLVVVVNHARPTVRWHTYY